MKGISPFAAGLLLLVGAAGLFRISGQSISPAALEISRSLVRQELGDQDGTAAPEQIPSEQPAASPSPKAAARPVPVETVAEAWDERRRQTEPEETAPPAQVRVEPDVSLELRNNTDYDVDFTALPALPEGLTVDSAEPVILIVHTHTTESYTVPGADPETAVYRSLEETDGVMAVGDAMKEVLERRGYGVIHDKTLCDYPEYNGAYNRSREVIQADLAKYPSVCLVIDLHRDAVADGSGGQLRLAAEIDGMETAQVMLVVGTDEGGLEHPDWRQNLSLAAVLQTAVNRSSPGLMRPINLRSERFNQDLGPLGLLMEVGTSGNTLEEALRGGRLAAGGIADVLDQYSGKYS